MAKNCDKYYFKVQRLKEEIKKLNDRIGDLESIQPKSDSIKRRISDLTEEKKGLEKRERKRKSCMITV